MCARAQSKSPKTIGMEAWQQRFEAHLHKELNLRLLIGVPQSTRHPFSFACGPHGQRCSAPCCCGLPSQVGALTGTAGWLGSGFSGEDASHPRTNMTRLQVASSRCFSFLPLKSGARGHRHGEVCGVTCYREGDNSHRGLLAVTQQCAVAERYARVPSGLSRRPDGSPAVLRNSPE